MKKITFLFAGIFICFFKLAAQRVGIGNNAPVSPLHVSGAAYTLLTVENTNLLAAGIQAGINFGHNLNAVSNVRFTGAIRTIGTNSSEARLGLFTGAGSQPIELTEKLSILNNGNVGIGSINPAFKLEVNGAAYIHTYAGILTPPNPTYALDVGGIVRIQGDVRINGILNPNNALAIGNDVSIEGGLTVKAGKGIIRNTFANQLRMEVVQATSSLAGIVNTIQPDGQLEISVGFSDAFSSPPVVYVGNIITDGNACYVSTSIKNVTTTGCKLVLTNLANSAVGLYSSTWKLVAIGAD